MTLDFSRPGRPTDNAFIEAFNGKLRQECLSAHWFLTLADVREKMEAWRRFYNEDRPHSAIGYNVPQGPPAWSPTAKRHTAGAGEQSLRSNRLRKSELCRFDWAAV